jgi:hypothetical protein
MTWSARVTELAAIIFAFDGIDADCTSSRATMQ